MVKSAPGLKVRCNYGSVSILHSLVALYPYFITLWAPYYVWSKANYGLTVLGVRAWEAFSACGVGGGQLQLSGWPTSSWRETASAVALCPEASHILEVFDPKLCLCVPLCR